MDFLVLCQRLRARAGISGSGPASVEGQTGEMARVVDWVRDAWVDLQSVRADWGPLWRSLSLPVPAGAKAIEPPADWRIPSGQRFRFNDRALEWVRYDNVPDALPASGEPLGLCLRPDKKLLLLPAPTKEGVLTGGYYAQPQRLVEGEDTPWLPEHLQDAIIYQALIYYAVYEDAPEIYQDAQLKREQYLQRMTNELVPDPLVTGALA